MYKYQAQTEIYYVGPSELRTWG